MVLLLARRGTLSETTNFVMAHGLPSMSQNGVICIRVRAFSLSNKLLSASRYLPSPLALEVLVGYLEYGGEYMGTFETHGRLHQPFPFSIHFHGVCHFLGRQKAFALLQRRPYSVIAIVRNFTFLLDMAAILIQ